VITFWVYGVLINQRCFLLLESDFARVAKLLPTAERANGSLVFGIALGMIRQLSSASWSKRQSCSALSVKSGKATSSPPSVILGRDRFADAREDAASSTR